MSVSTGSYNFNDKVFSVTLNAEHPVQSPDYQDHYAIYYDVSYSGGAQLSGGMSYLVWTRVDGTQGVRYFSSSTEHTSGYVNIPKTSTRWCIAVYGDYYGTEIAGTYHRSEWFPLGLEKSVIFRIKNNDSLQWQFDFVSGGATALGVGVLPGSTSDFEVSETHFIDGHGFLRSSCQPTWEELHPGEAFSVAQSIRDQVLNVIRYSGDYSKSQCTTPPTVIPITIAAGAYKRLRNGADIGTGIGGAPSGGNSGVFKPGEGSVDSPGSTAQNTAVDAAKNGAQTGTGEVRLPTVLTPISDPTLNSPDVTSDAKSVVKALTDIHDRETVLWEQKEVADQRRADTFNQMLFGSGTGNAGLGAGSDPAGEYLGQAAGIGDGTGGSGYSVPQYDGERTEFGEVEKSIPAAPSGPIASITLAGREISFNLDNWGAAEPARQILLAGRPVLVWALAIGFLIWCGHELQTYLIGLTLAPQADSNVGLENIGPGVVQAKTWGSAALIVVAICAAFAAAVAIVNTWATSSGGVGLAGIFSGSLGGLGGGIGLLDKYFPVLSVLQYAALRAAFHFSVGPMYLATAASIKFMKA